MTFNEWASGLVLPAESINLLRVGWNAAVAESADIVQRLPVESIGDRCDCVEAVLKLYAPKDIGK